MAVTILEIAEKLSLSHTTVSRVLNNRNNAFISEETRRRVLAAAREMGYRPNLAARSLRDSKTNMVGVFGSRHVGVWSGLAPDIVRGISDVMLSRQFDLFFAFSAEDKEEKSGFPAWRFDGAIVLQAPPAVTMRHLIECGQPYVCINEQIEGSLCILCDDTEGVRHGMAHLRELGHRRIAYANAYGWHMDHYSVTERQSAYAAWQEAHGCEPMEGYIQRREESDMFSFVRDAVLNWKATAIVAYDHVVAIDILGAAQKLGMRIPQDFSLLCFNDDFPVSRLVPALTVIAPKGREMGILGAEILIQRMNAPEETGASITRIPEHLIVRESTAPPPGGTG